jgi:HEAT repeat protein
VTGSPALACALLDARTRRALVSALEGRLPVEPHPLRVRVTLSEGTLRLECRGVWRTSSERVTRLLRGGLALARLLTLPADFPRRIASNLRDEPDPGVRLNALLTLAREYPNHPATRPALLAARQDEGAEIRLRAALALGEDGRETLLALVRGEQVEDGCAARAVAGLGEQLTEDEAIATLHRALDSGHSQTAIACLEALSARPSAMTEPALLMAFENAPTEARLAAVRALGRAGSTAAVSDLLAASETGPSALRAAARQAIAEIQSRLPGAGPGQLTLAAGEAGALTIPDDQPGALSLLDAEHGRSSPLETSEPAAADETQGRPPPSPPRLRTRE